MAALQLHVGCLGVRSVPRRFVWSKEAHARKHRVKKANGGPPNQFIIFYISQDAPRIRPLDDFGDPSLEKGLISQMVA
jgi:hypothetical protein